MEKQGLIVIENVKGYLTLDGTAYLNTEDVARGLGFTQIKNGIEYVRWETVKDYLKEFSFPTSWENKIPTYIPENIFYKLCFKAKNETARKFQDFVTDKVLPAIRKTGGYIAGEENMTEDELVLKAMQVLKTKVESLRNENKVLEARIEEDKPKVLFANSVKSSKTSVLIGELAKIIKQNGYDIGQNRMFEWLRENGYLISRRGTDYNMPTQKSMDLGLFEIKETSITHSNGYVTISKTPKVTGKGQVYFVNKFMGYYLDDLESKNMEHIPCIN